MSHEWLLVALPLVFALGWFAARLDIRHIRRSAATLPRAYLRGLSELLNGNEAKALDAFSDIAQIETLPPELQFTVGELSRRRGDYRRALKTHRQLHDNERLTDADRHRALWELANDCAAMGFVDAAEQHALQLADIPAYSDRVFDFLLLNYQHRHRHADALALIENADDDIRQLQRVTAAQLYCELAEASGAGDASALLENALQINPLCARAKEARARTALAEKSTQSQSIAKVETLCDEISNDSPAHLWRVADIIMAAQPGEQGQHKLRAWLRRYPSPMLLKITISLFENAAEHGDGTAKQQLREVINAYVAEHGGVDAAALYIANHPIYSNRSQWLAVQQSLLDSRKSAFSCTNCHYQMDHFAWQCPCCLRWESMSEPHTHAGNKHAGNIRRDI